MKTLIAFPQIGANFTPNGCKSTENIYQKLLIKAQLSLYQTITRIAYDYDKIDSALALSFAAYKFSTTKIEAENYPVNTEKKVTLQTLLNNVNDNTCTLFIAEPWLIQELALNAGHAIESPSYGESGKLDAIRFNINGDDVKIIVLTINI